jgi:hypothetical protein
MYIRSDLKCMVSTQPKNKIASFYPDPKGTKDYFDSITF